MTSDVELLHSYVIETVGAEPAHWPGGWPGEIETALVDAVFSVRAKYGSRERETGVFGAVQRYRRSRGGTADDLRVLASFEETELVRLTNGGKLARRTKAAVAQGAAAALVETGVVHSADLADRQAEARSAYLSVMGCGPVTWQYFRMLLGYDDVKPDTWVMRFVQDRLPDVTTTADATALVTEVASQLGVPATDLDHAIWRWRRNQH